MSSFSDVVSDELEVLQSIYEQQLEVSTSSDLTHLTYRDEDLIITFVLSPNYPAAKTDCEISFRGHNVSVSRQKLIRKEAKQKLTSLQETNSVVAFETIEKIREVYNESNDEFKLNTDDESEGEDNKVIDEIYAKDGLTNHKNKNNLNIIHGSITEEKLSKLL